MARLFDPAIYSITNADGSVSSGAKLYWYATGTDTPQDTFTTSALNVARTNPVVADINGRFPAIWLSDLDYKMILKDSDGTTLATRDPVGNLPVYQISATQSYTVAPLGNSGSTKNSWKLQGATVTGNANAREFMHIVSLTSSHGFGGTAGNDKVTSYRSIVAAQGTADVWVDNLLLEHSTTSAINTHIVEFDYNMLDTRDYGTTLGGAGLAAPSAWGAVMTGVTTSGGSITGAYGAAGINDLFQRGYVAATGIIQSGFEDDSAAGAAFRSCGANVDGLNTVTASYSGSAIRVANAHKISGNKAAGTSCPIALITAGDNLQLGTDGSTSVTNVQINSNFLPVTTNTISLGASGGLYTAVWATNGTIQTSDPALKSELETIPADRALRLLAAIEPKTFKWKIGGYDKVTTTRKEFVPATEKTTIDQAYVEVVDGIAYQRSRQIEVERELYDMLPIMGEDGQQIIETVKGQLVRGVMTADRLVPKYHRVPRMVEVEVETESYVEKPGNRLHWGWNAEQVKAAFDAEGLDFGGYILGEDGTKALRPDQLIPVLWAAVKALSARVEVLEAADA